MLTSIILSYLPYSLVTGFTPEPNNIVSLYAISQKGWQKGKHVLTGVIIGFLCVMVICAIGCYELARYIPFMLGILNYVGAAYILYLAIQVALSKPKDNTHDRLTFMSGFFLNFVNVKIILFAITVYSGYILPYDTDLYSLLIHAVVLTLICSVGNLTWAIAGGLLQQVLRKYEHPFNMAMALVLLWCAVSLAFDL